MLIVTWDECNCDAPDIITPDEDADIPASSSDTDVIAYLRGILDPEGQAPEDGWRMTAIVRTPATATVEWRSDRNHLAVTTVIWGDDE